MHGKKEAYSFRAQTDKGRLYIIYAIVSVIISHIKICIFIITWALT